MASPIKNFSLEIIADLKKIGYKKIKKQWLIPIADRLVNYVFVPAINESDDTELFNDMFNIYKKLQKYFERMETITLVQQAENLGSPKVPRIGDIKKALELIESLEL